LRIISKLKEERLEEAASMLVDLPEVGIVVPDESVSVSDGCSDQVGVRELAIVRHVCRKSEVELVRFLTCCCVLIVVSSEWEERSNLVPSCAQVT